jgi:hypothetical protein
MNPILGIIASSKFGVTTAYESIATATVGSGGTAYVEFASIPSTYTHLQLRFITGNSAAIGNSGLMTFNSDATTANYYVHYLRGDGASATAAAANGNYFPYFGGNSTYFQAGVIDILDYANTSKYKTSRGLFGWDANNTGTSNDKGSVYLESLLWKNTNAISTIRITGDGGNLVQYSSFALYGIKGA